MIGEGFFFATQSDILREDAMTLLEGLAAHMILIIAGFGADVVRVGIKGDNGSNLNSEGCNEDTIQRISSVSCGKLQPLSPFGCFSFSSSLKSEVNYFFMNEVIAEILARGNSGTAKSAIHVISHINGLVKSIDAKRFATGMYEKGKNSKSHKSRDPICCLSHHVSHNSV